MSRALITGATGFVGRAVCDALIGHGWSVRAAVRGAASSSPRGCETVITGDLANPIDWSPMLEGVDQIVHAAAHVHAPTGRRSQRETFFTVNGRAVRMLAKAAAAAGVRRFVHLSSIKVNGEETSNRPFGPLDEPRPEGFYAQSKLMGEQALLEIGAATRMEVAIIRPPLVYGPGVGANFRRLLAWVGEGRLLPLGAVRNARSLVNIWNLVDLIERLMSGPVPGCRVWMVSDGEDLSTPDLARRMAVAMGQRSARLIRMPPLLLNLAGAAAGRREEMRRLCNSLSVDISATRADLQWSPPVSVDEALRRTAAWYLNQGHAAAQLGSGTAGTS